VTATMDLPTQRADEANLATPEVDPAPSNLEDTPADLAGTAEAASGSNPLAGLSEEELAALHAQWDAEINTVIHINPDEALLAENVRTENAEADPATTANFKNNGVNTAANGYRNYETGIVMITEGQRRFNNARAAGVELPVWMKTPPPTDERKATIERIVRQLDENDLRKPLTLGDNARAIQQLAAFNLTPAGIARKLARGKNGAAYVKQVLQAGESELALKAAERFDLDLVQAAVVAEFDKAGDHETAKELVRIARAEPNNFQVFAQAKRAEHAKKQRLAALVTKLTRELTAANVTIFGGSLTPDAGEARSLDRLRPSPEDAPYTALTAEDHASCPGHGVWIEDDHHDGNGDRVAVAVYGCADFRAHGHALSHAPVGRVDLTPRTTSTADTGDGDGAGAAGEESDLAAARAALAADERARTEARIIRRWVRKNNELIDASDKPRRKWLAEFALRKTAPKGAQLFLARQKAHGGYELRRAFNQNHALARQLLGLPVGSTVTDLSDKVATASTPGKATVYDMFLTFCAMEDALSRNAWRYPQQAAQEYMTALVGAGYPASDVERLIIEPQSERDVIAAALGEATPSSSDNEERAARRAEVPEAGTAGGSDTDEPGNDGSHVGAGIDDATHERDGEIAGGPGDATAQELSEGSGAPVNPDVAAAEPAGAAS
jgi:ParB family chromosome partitioning protein